MTAKLVLFLNSTPFLLMPLRSYFRLLQITVCTCLLCKITTKKDAGPSKVSDLWEFLGGLLHMWRNYRRHIPKPRPIRQLEGVIKRRLHEEVRA